MTPKEILERAEITKNVLTRKDISAILARHPDADWSIEINPFTNPNVRIDGALYLTKEREDLGLDITEIANSVDSDDWIYRDMLTLFQDDEVSIKLYIYAFQPLEEEEKELLRALGKLQRITPETHSYETVICEY